MRTVRQVSFFPMVYSASTVNSLGWDAEVISCSRLPCVVASPRMQPGSGLRPEVCSPRPIGSLIHGVSVPAPAGTTRVTSLNDRHHIGLSSNLPVSFHFQQDLNRSLGQ